MQNELSMAERLNQFCACQTLDRPSLNRALARELGDADGSDSPFWHQAFASTAVFIPEGDLEKMRAAVRSLEKAAAMPDYRETVLKWAPSSAHTDPGAAGVFMGYDFHLSTEGPRLIEINTNAGGAFLNAMLARAQQRCCTPRPEDGRPTDFNSAVIRMFETEWRRQRGSRPLRRVAIVDDRPAEQYLYPEFLLAKKLFEERGIEAVIVDPGQLIIQDAKLKTAMGLEKSGEVVDLVYNRVVDFGLEQGEHESLRRAWMEDLAVVTPNPRVHALLADKRNLTLLSDFASLRDWGLDEASVENLSQTVPLTRQVSPEHEEELWQDRKKLFFKPATGHGSKGVYRGSKVTKSVFARILHDDYIAQTLVPPSERVVLVNAERRNLKVDVRLYTYQGDVLLFAARLYQGQATNFRSEGGGFAPVFVA